MQDTARLFAYSTWGLMISLGIIIFTHPFFQFINESLFTLIFIPLAFAFLYFNLAHVAVKRFIRKVVAPTNLHILLALLIFLPPLAWIIIMNKPYETEDFLLILVLLIAIVSGTIMGNKAGIKARYEYIQMLKEAQKKSKASS